MDVIKYCKGGAIIVDDGSTDKTVKILNSFKSKIKLNIKCLKKNHGAGFAKDFGIKLSKTKYFLVCDSDNIYNTESIKKLYEALNKFNLDAAHFQKGYHFFEKSGSKVDHICDWLSLLKGNQFNTLNNLLKYNVLLDNFMMSKKSYLLSEGYPKNHGFDTQGLSVNYLLKNPRIKIVKNSFYFHRRFKKIKSYYERESQINRNSINFFLVYEKLIKYKKDILINFFYLKTFDHRNHLYDHLNLKDIQIKNKSKKLTVLNCSRWYKYFEKKNYSKLITISIALIRQTNFSDLSIYLLIRSIFYNLKGRRNENDIECFEILRNFYDKREYKTLKEKIYSKIFSIVKRH